MHPGEILADELSFLDVSASALAQDLDVPVNRVTQILNGERGITADTALRLSRWLGASPEMWLTLQLRKAEAEVGALIRERVRPRDAAA